MFLECEGVKVGFGGSLPKFESFFWRDIFGGEMSGDSVVKVSSQFFMWPIVMSHL